MPRAGIGSASTVVPPSQPERLGLPTAGSRSVRGREGFALSVAALPVVLGSFAIGAALAPKVAADSGVVVSNYTAPSINDPQAITTGPDGALWFTNDPSNSIGRITTAGVVSNYTDPSISFPYAITAGPDGAVWFTNYGNNSIGRITAAGAVSNYTDPSIRNPSGITLGPDGALWFTNYCAGSIGRITTAGVVSNYTDPSISCAIEITTGPDGALWFTNDGNNSIGRITTAGVVTNYTDPSFTDGLFSITTGSDGALWFIDNNNGSIGRISTTGVVTRYPSVGNTNNGITAGSDGALWFTNNNDVIERITTAGVVSNYTDPTIREPYAITAGPDGNIWFTNVGNNSIGRVSISDTDLALAGVPSNIAVNATSPSGAVVTYTAPTAVDVGDSPPATASCDHASGVTYPIGTTTVTCTASSADDTPATVSQSFTVTINGAAAQITTISNQVASLTNPPIVKSALSGLLQAAQNALSRGATRTACTDLAAFRVAVQVLERVPPPFGIPPAQAAPMIAEAQQARATLGC
jgi:streptogramin lyase